MFTVLDPLLEFTYHLLFSWRKFALCIQSLLCMLFLFGWPPCQRSDMILMEVSQHAYDMIHYISGLFGYFSVCEIYVNLIWYLYLFMLNKLCLSLSLSLSLLSPSLLAHLTCTYFIKISEHPILYHTDLTTVCQNGQSSQNHNSKHGSLHSHGPLHSLSDPTGDPRGGTNLLQRKSPPRALQVQGCWQKTQKHDLRPGLWERLPDQEISCKTQSHQWWHVHADLKTDWQYDLPTQNHETPALGIVIEAVRCSLASKKASRLEITMKPTATVDDSGLTEKMYAKNNQLAECQKCLDDSPKPCNAFCANCAAEPQETDIPHIRTDISLYDSFSEGMENIESKVLSNSQLDQTMSELDIKSEPGVDKPLILGTAHTVTIDNITPVKPGIDSPVLAGNVPSLNPNLAKINENVVITATAVFRTPVLAHLA